MPSAKENFLHRIDAYDKAVAAESVTTQAYQQTEHNLISKLLRNGLSIIAFAILEDFFKSRTGEILTCIGESTVPFTKLPIKLQEAATIGAMKSLHVHAMNLKTAEEDWLAFIQEESARIGSTKNSSYELSAYSLGWERSNLNKDDISNFLGIFKVEGGWDAIRRISCLANVSLTSPKDAFNNAALRRHSAAHDASADTPIIDLIEFSSQARILAFCFDGLISKSLHYIQSNDNEFIEGGKKTTASDIKIRELNKVDGKWKEFTYSKKRAIKADVDYNSILPVSIKRAKTKQELLLIKDEKNTIVNWFTFN